VKNSENSAIRKQIMHQKLVRGLEKPLTKKEIQ
jgi:hypothetical protein